MRYLSDYNQFILEANQSPSVTCGFYADKTPDKKYDDFWAKFNQLPEDQKQRVVNNLGQQIKSVKQASIDELTEWYNKPETIKKFVDQGIVTAKLNDPVAILQGVKPGAKKSADSIRKEMLEHLKKIKVCLRYNNGPIKGYPKINLSDVEKPWGFFNLNYNDVVFVNLYNFWNGDEKGDKNVKDTIKHEFSHLIDHFMAIQGVRVYLPTHQPTKTQEEYQKIYNANDKDQFARLNILRSLIDAKGDDSGDVLLKKFAAKIKDGTIKSDNYFFGTGKMNVGGEEGVNCLLMRPTPDFIKTEVGKKLIKPSETVKEAKNTPQQTDHFMYFFRDGIYVNGKSNINIQQLFACYAKSFVDSKTGYMAFLVNFDELAKFNLTTVKVDNPNQSSVASTTA